VQTGTGDSGGTATTEPTSPTEPGTYVKVPVTVAAGLRLRAASTTASDTVAIEPPGAFLRVTESVEGALSKIGAYDQWIKVRDEAGRDGYVAAWYVQKGITVPPVEDGEETGGATEPTEPEPVPEPVPVTPPEPESTPEPVEEHQPEIEGLTVYVLQSVGTVGLRLRKTPSLGGTLVAIESAGTALTALEPEGSARLKIGVKGKWLQVSDPKNLQGYVAAEYVELRDESASPVPGTDEADVPEPVAEVVTIYVSEAAAAGLRLRSAPNTNSSTLKILPANTSLTLLEGTLDLIGKYNIWLKVREPEGTEGFVAAWYVRK